MDSLFGDHSEVISHLLYLCGLLATAILSGIAAYISHRMNKSVDEVNDAVNHRHAKGGPGAPKLYDAMLHLHEKLDSVDAKTESLMEWKIGYQSSINPFKDADGIREYVQVTEAHFKEIEDKSEQRHNTALKALNDHKEHFQQQVDEVRNDIRNLQIRPPCVLHEQRLDALEKLVQLHEKELDK